MAVYLVTYDLNNEVRRPNLLKAIKDMSNGWAMLSESSYAIAIDMTASDVYNSLSKYIDNDDQLYVITLKKPYSGYGANAINEWLENNLSY